MDNFSRKEHWEKIYSTKSVHELSWFQEYPRTSIEFISNLKLTKTAKIIDVGGGDSTLVDILLEKGYTNLYVLDISAHALDRAKERLGKDAKRVNWIVSDITEFETETKFDLWHDRATFHFLTNNYEITKYLNIARNNIVKGGYMILATFSEKAPKTCNGLNVKQYSETRMNDKLRDGFEKIRCMEEEHITPFNTCQNFLFCSFRRKEK